MLLIRERAILANEFSTSYHNQTTNNSFISKYSWDFIEALKDMNQDTENYSNQIDLILSSLSEETQTNIKNLNDERCQFVKKSRIPRTT